MTRWTMPELRVEPEAAPAPVAGEAGDQAFARQFGQHIEQRILPLLRDIERDRRRTRALYRWRRQTAIALGASLALIGVLALFRLLPVEAGVNQAVLWGAAAAIALLIHWGRASPAAHAVSRRARVVPELLALYGRFAYAPDAKLNERLLTGSHLFGGYSVYAGSDRVTGSHKDLAFGFGRALVKIRQGSDFVPMFHGYLVSVSLRRPMEGLTLLGTGAGGQQNRLAELLESYPNLVPIPFYIASVREMFEVRSTEEKEARRLITVNFARSVRGLATLLEASSVAAAIWEGHLLLRFETREDLLAAEGLNEPADHLDDLPRYAAAINGVLAIVEAVAEAEATG